MKILKSTLLTLVFILSLCVIAVNAESIEYSISGTATPGEDVTLMITSVDADMKNLSADKVKKVEVVTASKDNGSYSAKFKLLDAELDANGNITNYALHSNLKELDITDGTYKILGETGFYLVEGEFSVDSDGIVFVPLVDTFKKLDIEMKETESGRFEGFGKNGEIIITIGENTAEVDWVDIELPAATKYENGVAMIPAYLIEDAARTKAPVYNSINKTLRIEYPDENAVYEKFFSLTDKLSELSGIEKQVILDNDDLLYSSWVGGSASLISKELVSVEGESFDKAVRVNINPTSDGTIPQGQALRLNIQSNEKEIKAGEVAVLSFKARATYATDETRAALATVLYERSDWKKALEASLTIQQGTWQQFDLLVHSDYYDMWAGSHVFFNLGGKAQTLEIADFSLTYYGGGIDVTKLQPENPYKGMGDDALWRKEAYRRIDKYRKDDTNITVTDKDGNPVKDAVIEVKQTQNEYMFGIAVVKDEVLDIDEETKVGKIRKDILENSNNTLVCGSEMKSDEMVNNDGINGIRMANEFIRLGKRIRGHTIFWDGEALLNIDGYEKMPYDEAYRKVMDYVIPAAYTFKGRIQQWDVLNEILEANFTRANHNTTRLYADVIKKVREIDPDVKLYVNETGFVGGDTKGRNGRITGFRNLVEQMQLEGAPVDGIGIQAHCSSYHYPQGFYIELDQFAEFVDEIAITEYDFRNVREEYADEHLRDMLLVTFSHPKTTCFTIWGYWDPLHWRQSAPFYDADWNEKPAKAVWDNMINNEFKTNVNLTTDSNGKTSFRGFLGDYEITVKANGLEKTVPYKVVKNEDNTINIVLGNTISINVSNVPDEKPEPIPYTTWNEAREEYYSMNDRIYNGVVIESTMDGIADSSIVASGNVNLENVSSWQNGKTWGTYYGTTGMLKDAAHGTMLVEQTSAKDGVNLRHHIASEIITDDCDLEMSYIIQTQSARTNSYNITLAMRDTADRVMGYIKNDKSGYYLETLKGKKIALSDNTRYEIFVTLVSNRDGYDVRYDVKENCYECIETVTEAQTQIDSVSGINSVALKLKSEGGTSQDVLLMISVRLKYIIDDAIIDFSNLGYSNILVQDTLSGFDTSAINYTENPELDSDYMYGLTWVGHDSNFDAGLMYENRGKYLWTTMPADTSTGGKKHIISRHFEPAKNSDELVLTAKVKVPKLASFYNSPGYAKLTIGSLDGSIEKDIFKLRMEGFGRTHEILLLDKEDNTGEIMYYSSDWNNKNLDLTFKLTKNSSGAYDAEIGLYDFRTGNTLSHSVADYITAEELEKINTLFITTQKVASGNTPAGSKVFGIKNILFTKTNSLEASGEVFEKGNQLAIDFNNVTEWPFNASLIVGAYKGNKLINAEIISSGRIEFADGELRFTPKECGQDYFKVFLLEDVENMVPYKKAEQFNITKQ